MSFGSFLIKQVVTELSLQIPRLKNFVTLSPIPGFGRWLRENNESLGLQGMKDLLPFMDGSGDVTNEESGKLKQIEKPLLALAAKYFLEAKLGNGLPLDPVARFHLGNGASLHQINWMADCTSKGRRQSCGLMVNYLYDLDTIEANHEAYARERKIIARKEIRSHLKNLPSAGKSAA